MLDNTYCMYELVIWIYVLLDNTSALKPGTTQDVALAGPEE